MSDGVMDTLLYKENVKLDLQVLADDQMIIKNAIYMLRKAGYQMKATQIFMLVNGKVPFSECKMKLDLMKVWNVQVSDCWFDNQIRGSVIPEYWTNEECKEFGKLCRKHNQIVNFGVDPEWKVTTK